MKIIATLMAAVLIVSAIAGAAGAQEPSEPEPEPETRATMLRVLYEHFGAGAEPPPTPTFEDVPASHPAYAAIEWAAKLGITTGYGDGTFRPEVSLSDRHAELFMQRLATTFELTTFELSPGLETAAATDDDPPVVRSGSVGPPASWTDFLADNSPSGVRTVRGEGRVNGASGALECVETGGDRRSGVLGSYYDDTLLGYYLDLAPSCSFEWVGYGDLVAGYLQPTLLDNRPAAIVQDYPNRCVEYDPPPGETARIAPGIWRNRGPYIVDSIVEDDQGVEYVHQGCSWLPEIRERVPGTRQPIGELDVYWDCVAGTETREMEVHRSTTLDAPEDCNFTLPNNVGTYEQGLAGEEFEWYENGPDASGTTYEENPYQYREFWSNYWNCDEFNNCVRSGD